MCWSQVTLECTPSRLVAGNAVTRYCYTRSIHTSKKVSSYSGRGIYVSYYVMEIGIGIRRYIWFTAGCTPRPWMCTRKILCPDELEFHLTISSLSARHGAARRTIRPSSTSAASAAQVSARPAVTPSRALGGCSHVCSHRLPSCRRISST